MLLFQCNYNKQNILNRDLLCKIIGGDWWLESVNLIVGQFAPGTN
jgi:hypothetical protein